MFTYSTLVMYFLGCLLRFINIWTQKETLKTISFWLIFVPFAIAILMMLGVI